MQLIILSLAFVSLWYELRDFLLSNSEYQPRHYASSEGKYGEESLIMDDSLCRMSSCESCSSSYGKLFLFCCWFFFQKKKNSRGCHWVACFTGLFSRWFTDNSECAVQVYMIHLFWCYIIFFRSMMFRKKIIKWSNHMLI